MTMMYILILKSADQLTPAGGRESILRARDKKHFLYFPAYFAETFNCLCAKTRKIKISIRGTRRQGGKAARPFEFKFSLCGKKLVAACFNSRGHWVIKQPHAAHTKIINTKTNRRKQEHKIKLSYVNTNI